MKLHLIQSLPYLFVPLFLVAGCSGFGWHASDSATSPAASPSQTANAQLLKRSPALEDQKFSVLLDFESDSDGVFVAVNPPGRMVYDRAYSGARSVVFAPGSDRVAFKLGSLMSGRPFPGEWTLIGAFLYCEKPIDVTISFENFQSDFAPRTVSLSAGRWTCALADISENLAIEPGQTVPANALLVLRLPEGAPPVWCDDVLLIDNTRSLVGNTIAPAPSTEPATGQSKWSVQQRGLSYRGQAPGKFKFRLLTTDALASGWTLEEANTVRARFTSDGGKKTLTVYGDGRSYHNGEYQPLAQEMRNPIFAEEHTSPADVIVPEAMGRVDRNTPGDANNDGYNERRGSYQIIASGARLEVQLSPRTRSLVNPVLEIRGFPPGGVLVTVEGRLIESTVRLDDGTLLVELPVRFERPTTISLRSQ